MIHRNEKAGAHSGLMTVGRDFWFSEPVQSGVIFATERASPRNLSVQIGKGVQWMCVFDRVRSRCHARGSLR
jgi:hypothetical protein